jgi:hypothetical protein
MPIAPIARTLQVGLLRLELAAYGFGVHESAIEGAVVRLRKKIEALGSDADLTLLQAQADSAVREETKNWICWRENFSGDCPRLQIVAAGQ